MQTISYSSLRQNLSAIMNKIESERDTVHITRKNHESMVMMSEDDYNSMQETLYLLSNPNNAKRLYESIDQANNGDFVEVDLD